MKMMSFNDWNLLRPNNREQQLSCFYLKTWKCQAIKRINRCINKTGRSHAKKRSTLIQMRNICSSQLIEKCLNRWSFKMNRRRILNRSTNRLSNRQHFSKKCFRLKNDVENFINRHRKMRHRMTSFKRHLKSFDISCENLWWI